ncbi:MAG: DUF4097 family beta strand repeat protein [Sciscionella sp.]|nr:DUF4097 family beta strand repeat protein [Sciscionella sp.]
MGRPALAIGGVALIAMGMAIALNWWWPRTAQADAEVSQHIHTVRLSDSDGDVTVRVDDTTRQTSVHETFRYSWGKPDTAYTVDGDTLVLGGCGHNCTVSYTVVVPSGTTFTGTEDSGDVTLDGLASVDVQANSGKVTAHDVSGAATVHAKSGDVELSAIDGATTVQTNSGAVHAEGLRGNTDVTADSGDVVLSTDAVVDVHAKANSGDIAVTVPMASYRIAGSSDHDDRRTIDVPTDPNAAHTLDLTADSGDVKVNAR